MIWSVIPEELIFANRSPEEALTIVNYLGRRIVLCNGRVETLLSTDPRDHLDPRFAPGTQPRNPTGIL